VKFMTEFTLEDGTPVQEVPSDDCIIKIKSVIERDDFDGGSLQLFCAHYTKDRQLLNVESSVIDKKQSIWEGQVRIMNKDDVIKVMLWQDVQTIKPVAVSADFNVKTEGEGR